MTYEGPRPLAAMTLAGGLCLALLASSSSGGGAPPALSYYTLAPCRVVDTRGPAGALGGPALEGQVDRVFPLVGTCGVPPNARAVSLNVTVTQPQEGGNLRLYPADEPVPLASTLNYSAGQTRGNNAIVRLSATGGLGARAAQPPATTTHMIVDVNGYFAPSADVVIEIVGMLGSSSYSPNPASVNVGQTVAWHNADSLPHTATEDTSGFDTGTINSGETSAPILMTTPGMFPYHCTFHPSMVGRLDVN
jgi:plastocyanin